MKVARKIDLMTLIIQAGFAGKVRICTKDGPRIPSWTHSVRVMLMLQSYGYSPEVFLGGGAHDLFEDTIISYQFIVDNFNARIADLAQACSILPDLGDTKEGEDELYARVTSLAKAGDVDPLRIKVADAMDNNRNVSQLDAHWAPAMLDRGFAWLAAANEFIRSEGMVEDFGNLLRREKTLMR